MNNRYKKLSGLKLKLLSDDIFEAKKLFQEIFYGCSGKKSDPGMAGSLLYHMAMITKMESEPQYLLDELKVPYPDVNENLERFFKEFVEDAHGLVENPDWIDGDLKRFRSNKSLETKVKIDLFLNLTEKTKKISKMLDKSDPRRMSEVSNLFQEWATNVIEMRLRQEYETIKGILILSNLSKNLSLSRLDEAMRKVKDSFGQETVNIALETTLKVGFQRDKLQSIMLSDHFINYTMDMEQLRGNMKFMNCPIHGGHQYIGEKLGISKEVTSLFCKHFCFAHAKSMLETVLPFTFILSQPELMATHGQCQFDLKIGRSTTEDSTKHIPLVVSWNVTRECNLKCSHCYINAASIKGIDELDTEESKRFIDQLSEVSLPLLILSGGEPLLRSDIFELIRYGTKKGLRMGLGSNGSLIDENIALKLRDSGIKTVSISLDSSIPEKHDEFRGVIGSWQKAVNAIKVLKKNGVLVQVNTTLTQNNYDEIEDIMSLVEDLGVENFHLFFLVPTGRGSKIEDISPAMYEKMIKETFKKTSKHPLNVRPSCAPQFMRIAKDLNLDMRQWIRGCIAGLYYCRIFANGDVTPCPYLPVKLGNVREKPFRDIWFKSEIFKKLRDFNSLKGKCGNCEFKAICGGCRARAYGLSSDFIDYCGDMHEPGELKGDYLAEDPWCLYKPNEKS